MFAIQLLPFPIHRAHLSCCSNKVRRTMLSGHSEGARTTYHWDKVDPQIVGAVLHHQSCSKDYAHLWRLHPSIRTWQILEKDDPWSQDARWGSCGHHFPENYQKNFTLLHQEGRNHDPLQNKDAIDSLDRWLKDLIPEVGVSVQTHNETLLDEIQRKIYPDALK